MREPDVDIICSFFLSWKIHYLRLRHLMCIYLSTRNVLSDLTFRERFLYTKGILIQLKYFVCNLLIRIKDRVTKVLVTTESIGLILVVLMR